MAVVNVAKNPASLHATHIQKYYMAAYVTFQDTPCKGQTAE